MWWLWAQGTLGCEAAMAAARMGFADGDLYAESGFDRADEL